MANQPKKKEHDPLFAMKYRAYCRALTPPGDDTTIEDFTTFAKFYLCRVSRRLWKDPIWDEYTGEEILIEYFAHLFATDKSARTAFEVRNLSGSDMYGEEIFDWLDRMVAKNQEETNQKLDEMPEKVSFKPEKSREE